MITAPLYQHIAQILGSLAQFRKSDVPSTWKSIWENRLLAQAEELPHGSGFDSQAIIEDDKPFTGSFTILGSYHKMDANGYYCGWEDFKVTVKPSLAFDFQTRIVCADKNLREYIGDAYEFALRAEFSYDHFMEKVS